MSAATRRRATPARSAGRASARQLAGLSAIAVAIPDLLYYNTGWEQYGYRFLLDFAPFLMLLLAMSLRRPLVLPARLLVGALLAISIVSNYLGARWFLHLPPY